MKKVKITVKGHVQGVGFRWYVRASAVSLGLSGYVRNVPDGTVEILAAGEAGKIDELVRELAEGPGSVTDVGVRDTGEETRPGFRITF